MRVLNLQFESNLQDFFMCHPAKHTALSVQHTRTQKKYFPWLIFGTRISDLPSKYNKALSFASEFRDTCVHNYCKTLIIAYCM